MTLLLTLFLSLSLQAQPTVSGVTADYIGTSTARVCWTSSGTPDANWRQRIRWGTTASYEGGAVGGIQNQYALAASTVCMNLSGLPSNTTIHVCPQTSSNAGSTWSSCGSDTFVTLARGSQFPALPTAPESFSAAYPNTSGYTTRTVASDCSDLQTKINDAVTNQATAGSLVTIPAGTICTGTYTTPADPAAKSFSTSNVNTSTERITVTGHGWSNGQGIRFARGGCLPGSSPGVPDAFCQLRGQIVQGRVYYVVGATTDDFQVALTSGGSAIDLTDQGSGTNYVLPWPPTHSNEVIIRTATPDGEFAPTGTRLNPSDYSGKMATLRITGGTWNSGTMAFTPGIGAHHIRLMGLEITHSDASANLSGSTDPRPTYGLVNFDPANALSYITLDRVWLHGLGYPNRIYRPIYQLDGKAMAIVDSYLDKWDFWRPGKSGLTPSLASQTVTITTGSTNLRASQACTASSAITFTRTGGTTSATSKVYVALDCTPTIEIPTGTTATCSGSMTDPSAIVRNCSVLTVASPAYPRDAFNGFAALPLADVTASGGVWSGAADQYGNAPSAYITEGTNGMIGGWGPGPYKLENNYSEGVGLLWHFDESSAVHGPASGYTVRRNTFYMDPSKRTNGSSANGLRYMNRNGIEWKNGTNILIEGNSWDGFWADVSSTGYAILLTPQGGNKSQVTDVEIRYNTTRNGACFLSAIGGIAYAQWGGTTKPGARLYVHDNLIESANGWTQYEAQSRSSASAFPFYIGYAVEDVVIDHNTVFDNRGPAPQFWHHINQPVSGVSVTNNILWMNNDSGAYGLSNEFPGGSADPNCTATAKAGMDCAWLSGRTVEYTFRNNLLVPYYSNSSAQTGLVDSGTTSSNYSGLTSIYVQTGANVAARLAAVKFSDSVNSNFRLRYDSPYVSGGASRGVQYNNSIRLELGADLDAVEAAQGRVKNVRVLSITSSGATVYFTAPDAVGCSVDYSTSSAFTTFTRVSNSGGSRVQSVALTGLSSGTNYHVRVNCAREQPVVTFTTG